MEAHTRKPTKIREADYVASTEVLVQFPVLSRVDTITAFRLAFQRMSQKRKQEIVREVLTTRPPIGRPRANVQPA